MITNSLCKARYLLLLCASSVLSAEDANTDITGYVKLGSGYVTDGQYKFGEYNGLEEKGSYQLLDFVLFSPVRDNNHWSLVAENIGLSIPRVEFTFSQADKHEFSAEYRELTHHRSNSGRTVFTATDTNSLELPAGWVAANTTAGMTGLSGPLLRVKETLERKRLELAYEWLSGPDRWSFDIDYNHEEKMGNRVRYGIIGNTGGNPRAVALPTSVDFVFDDLKIQARYLDQTYSATVGYQLSQFNNGESQQAWRNPFSAINGWDTAAGYPNGRGAIALEPDNQYQQLFLVGTARLHSKTRINGRLDYGVMTQDEDFLPYTINPGLTITTPLPRDSLDGKIAIIRASLGLNHTLSPRMAMDINARHEKRENKTPTDLFIYVGGDSQNQSDAASSRARHNIPFDLREDELETRLRYRAGTSTNIQASYQYKNTVRDQSEVKELRQQTAGIAASNWLHENLQWRIDLNHERRRGSRYRGEKYFIASHTPAYINSLPADERFENLPALRRYYLADRDRDKAGLRIDWVPMDVFQMGLSINYAVDDYPDTDFGLTSSRMRSAYMDMSYIQTEKVNWSLYAGHERLKSRQMGRSFRGFAVASESQNPDRNWRHNNEDAVKTLGGELQVASIAPRTDMRLGYLLSRSISALSFGEGDLLSSAAIPDQGDKLIRLTIGFDHRYSQQLSIYLDAVYERYSATDFSTDGVTQGTLNSTILLGEETHDYSEKVFQVGLQYRF